MSGRDLVVIGGSVGGLEALLQVLAGIDRDSGVTVLVAIHRGPQAPGEGTAELRNGRMPRLADRSAERASTIRELLTEPAVWDQSGNVTTASRGPTGGWRGTLSST